MKNLVTNAIVRPKVCIVLAPYMYTFHRSLVNTFIFEFSMLFIGGRDIIWHGNSSPPTN